MMALLMDIIVYSAIVWLTSSQNTTYTPVTTDNISTTNNLFTTLASFCIEDISPNPDNTCLDFYRWNLCEETWMVGYCCGTCGYASCLDICWDNDVNNIPTIYYPNPFDCTSNIASDDVATCKTRKEWGNCPEWYMYGWCCLSCPEACNCEINNNLLNTTTLTPIIVTNDYNYTNSISNCQKDKPPPPGPDGIVSECIAQYRWGNCDQSWMNEYCCLTCGYVSCLDTCWNGSVENIPSKYYPNPFDCESNEFIEDEDDTCTDEREWGNCDEEWMYGLCCVSCPEACGCLNYTWGNNTAYIDLRPDVVVTLSFEEIIFWEKFYLSMHCIALFGILIILIMVCYKVYYNETMTKILHKMSVVHSDHSITSRNNGTTTIQKPASGTVSVSSKQSDLNPSSVSKQSYSSIKHRKVSDPQSKVKERIYSTYKLLAYISICLWTLHIVSSIIVLAIWMSEDGDKIMDDLSKPLQMFKILMYIIAKMLMYLSFLGRIYFTFRDSMYRYSLKFIIFLVVYLLIDTIMKIICYSEYIIKLSGNIIDRDIFDGNQQDYWLYNALIFVIVEEFIYTLIVIAAFVQPLFRMTVSANHISDKVLDVMSKYLLLGIICILSSAILSISKIFFISTTDLFIIWTTKLFESIDCTVNTWCTVFLFHVGISWYKTLCAPCDKCVKNIYLRNINIKQEHIELDEIVR